MIFYPQKGQTVFANHHCVATRMNPQGMCEVVLVGVRGGQLVLGEYNSKERAYEVIKSIQTCNEFEFEMPKV